MTNDPLEEQEGRQTAELIRAALTGPARPLRTDQIEALVARAVQRHSHPLPPMWVLILCSLSMIVLTGFGLSASFAFRTLADVVWLLPLLNLLAAPLAAYLIVRKASESKEQR